MSYHCISFVGIDDTEKVTITSLVAQHLSWAYIHTNHLIEAIYGKSIHNLPQKTKKTVLEIEAVVISSIKVQRTVLSIGQNAYSNKTAMEHLTSLGPTIYIRNPIQKKEDPNINSMDPPLKELYKMDDCYIKWAKHTFNVNSIPHITTIINILGLL